VNFAHGELVAFGAVVAFFLNASGGPRIPLIGATLIAVAAGALLGGGLEKGLWRPLRRRKTGLIQMLVSRSACRCSCATSSCTSSAAAAALPDYAVQRR
jgi:branched-subunit amino acid ABC-type transport system permease component